MIRAAFIIILLAIGIKGAFAVKQFADRMNEQRVNIIKQAEGQ